MIMEEKKTTDEQQKLLELLKIHIMIEYDESDQRLNNIIKNAIPDLQEKIGSEIDFTKPGTEQTFFLNYCKYCYFGQEHIFFQNYQNVYLQLRETYLVKDDEKNES